MMILNKEIKKSNLLVKHDIDHRMPKIHVLWGSLLVRHNVYRTHMRSTFFAAMNIPLIFFSN